MDAHQSSSPAIGPLPGPTLPSQGNGMGVAALVLGVFAILLFLVPFFGVILGILAIVFGVVALRSGRSRGMAIAGIATGATGILLGLLGLILMLTSYRSVQEHARDAASKVDVSTLAADINEYVAKNGKLPDDVGVMDGSFMEGMHGDGQWRHMQVMMDGAPMHGRILYRPHENCDGSTARSPLGFSVATRLEDGTVFCTGS